MKPKYFCSECKRNHYSNSEIGKKHKKTPEKHKKILKQNRMYNVKDLNGKGRRIQYIGKTNGFDTDINGNTIEKSFIEVMIMGKRGKWKMFYPLEEFKEMNPNIEI